jgi:hypothetical protein
MYDLRSPCAHEFAEREEGPNDISRFTPERNMKTFHTVPGQQIVEIACCAHHRDGMTISRKLTCEIDSLMHMAVRLTGMVQDVEDGKPEVSKLKLKAGSKR